MDILNLKNKEFAKEIKVVDDSILNSIAKECLNIKKDDYADTIYDNFYHSKYPVVSYISEELDLNEYIDNLEKNNSTDMKTKYQGVFYRHIHINPNNRGNIYFRYYFSPEPKNMYDMVKLLSDKFLRDKIPVSFKYQLQEKMENCDRIILYSDFEHNKDVERIIKEVYDENQKLFENSERAIPWIYKTNVPGVYKAPENVIANTSYGLEFAETMANAKKIFRYLYGFTDSTKSLNYTEEEIKQAIYNMKLIVSSLLLKSGFLFTKDDKLILGEKNERYGYNFERGELTITREEKNHVKKVTYKQNKEAKNTLLENFYTIKNIKPNIGVDVKYFNNEEYKNEIYKLLYNKEMPESKTR